MDICIFLMFSALKQKHGLTKVAQSGKRSPKGVQGSPKSHPGGPKTLQKEPKRAPKATQGSALEATEAQGWKTKENLCFS